MTVTQSGDAVFVGAGASRPNQFSIGIENRAFAQVFQLRTSACNPDLSCFGTGARNIAAAIFRAHEKSVYKLGTNDENV